MSMPSANLFIIISSPYATSVPPYDMAKMVACALVGSRLDYAYSVLFGTTQKKTSPNSRKHRTSIAVSSILPFTYSRPTASLIKHRIDFKTLYVYSIGLRSFLHAYHSTRSLRLSNTKN